LIPGDRDVVGGRDVETVEGVIAGIKRLELSIGTDSIHEDVFAVTRENEMVSIG
jgi:hypothetical protein